MMTPTILLGSELEGLQSMASEKIIFSGPSLGHNTENYGAIDFQPPCKQGDVYRATLQKPKVIGIIDGYFDGVPSVWHKEILWALNQGIHVVGAASMGALRAAELHKFGMTGLGQIFEWYKSGEITDDEEVAILHGPPELGFPTLSLPTVNVRACCNKAERDGILTPSKREIILRTAQEIHYKERTWQSMLGELAVSKLDEQTFTSFSAFIENLSVDQKSIDAQELCHFVTDGEFSTPFQSDFVFEETEFWYQNTKSWRQFSTDNKVENPEKRDGDRFRLFD